MPISQGEGSFRKDEIDIAFKVSGFGPFLAFQSPGWGTGAGIYQETLRLLDEHFSTRSTAEWMERLEAADIFCAPVYDYGQVSEEPQAFDNGYLVRTQHPRLGEVTVVNCPLEFSETPADASVPEPALGEHTSAVLEGLGYGADEIERLRGEGVV